MSIESRNCQNKQRRESGHHLIPRLFSGVGAPFLSASASKDSGLGFDGGQAGSVDNLTAGLNSLGLGGRGFPAYGTQGRGTSPSALNKMNFQLDLEDTPEDPSEPELLDQTSLH